MKRFVSLVTVTVVMVATMALPGIALATPQTDRGNPSCFGALAREPGTGGPGQGVSELASIGASQVADVLVGIIQENRPCPATPPPEIKQLFP